MKPCIAYIEISLSDIAGGVWCVLVKEALNILLKNRNQINNKFMVAKKKIKFMEIPIK